jgi:hypothetical protein
MDAEPAPRHFPRPRHILTRALGISWRASHAVSHDFHEGKSDVPWHQVNPSRACLYHTTYWTSHAYTELYLTTAALVRNFDLELVGSSIKNITMHRDYALPFDEDYDYGLKFKISRVLQED